MDQVSARPRPKIFTIPAGAPFLPVLADAVLDGRFAALDASDPLALADVTILLPTRRAVRALREIFVARAGGDGDHPADDPPDRRCRRGGPPSCRVGRSAGRPARLAGRRLALDRQLALARLILAWGRTVRHDVLALGPDEPLLIPASAADATRLAADLARLIDDMEVAGLPWDAIRTLAPEDHARYFQITLDFLKIAVEYWPARLKEMDRVDPIARRDRLIRAEAERLETNPPRGPIIAAGSTGSIPATADLLGAIARLPNGAVVLPGLDTRPRRRRLAGDRRGGDGAAFRLRPSPVRTEAPPCRARGRP